MRLTLNFSPLLFLCSLFVCGCSAEAPPSSTPGTAAGTTPATTATGAASTKSLTKVKLLLNWFPEAEHGGFYAALVNGYYRDVGLDVEIVPGGPNVPVVQQVATRQVQFGIDNADKICFGRAQEAPVVAVMAPLQISPRCLIVHEKSGIKKFDDIHDMTVAMSDRNAFSHFLRKKFPFKNVQIVPYPGNVSQFLSKPDFAQQGYVFSEPFIARQQGGDPHVLMVSDVGFNPYTSCLVTHDEMIQQEPNVVRGMVQASIRGWQEYLQNPATTNQAIQKLNKEMSAEVLAFGAAELKPLVLDPVATEQGVGHMSLERWQTLIDQLVEIDQLKAGSVKTAELFNTDFLQAAAEQPATKQRAPDTQTTPAEQPGK